MGHYAAEMEVPLSDSERRAKQELADIRRRFLKLPLSRLTVEELPLAIRMAENETRLGDHTDAQAILERVTKGQAPKRIKKK